ncbi:hypothetical protein GCK72_025016 [Caenorhabditis remanei]|uniref:Sdz-33 F-box domain-containing protein n=1 Tax=Caenorhabditis remanei TaxID=31234 RepID=A0A6A5G1Z1_CAERE|nr:hypothetical protein GCK72_025016 [Caenorhabditis remanei]KAF1748549.1 hypothetical protein GCK72_025016 [Caenorhabditis remanei]
MSSTIPMEDNVSYTPPDPKIFFDMPAEMQQRIARTFTPQEKTIFSLMCPQSEKLIANLRFPLMKLPLLARRLVVCFMSIEEKVFYSSLSMKCMRLTCSVSPKTDYIRLFVSTNMIMELNLKELPFIRFIFNIHRKSIPERAVPVPNIHSIKFDIGKGQSGAVEVKLREVITPAMMLKAVTDLFRCKNIDVVFTFNRIRYVFSSIRDVFLGHTIRSLTISEGLGSFTIHSIKELFPTEMLILEDQPYGITREMFQNNVLKQPLRFICLGRGVPINLQDLLVMESKHIELWMPHISPFEWNEFLVHWVEGTFNKNLESLAVQIDTRIQPFTNEGIILTGMPMKPIPLEQPWEYIMPYRRSLWTDGRAIESRYEIYGYVGKKATIIFEEDSNGIRFKMVACLDQV